MEPSDTTPEAQRVMIESLREMEIEGRARMTFELASNLRVTIESGWKYVIA